MMKFTHIILILISIVLVNIGCSNEFQVTEGQTEIPVVYGILSSQDTATYIRVEKAFVDENISASTLALDPANLYFENISVKLRHVSSGKEYPLQRVDGNKEGYKRDSGIFANAPNYLYKITRNELAFVPKQEYKLVVAKNDGNILTESSTKILTPLSDAKDDVGPKPGTMSFGYNSEFQIVWYPDENSVIHDVILVINFDETRNGVTTARSLDWTLTSGYSEKSGSSNSYSLGTRGKAFYEFLAASLSANETGNQVSRYFKDISIKIISGGQPIKDYINIGLANIGITSSGEVPVYSNMSNDARGIFSSKTQFFRSGMTLSKPSLDSLRSGIITKKLNFQ